MKTLLEKLATVDWSRVIDRQAYVAQAAFNLQIDARRQARAALRQAAREATITAEIEKLHAARTELAVLITDYLTACAKGDIETKWLEALSVLVGETTDAAIRERYGVSRDCVYQWRRRGRVLLQADFSPNLHAQMTTRLTRPSNWSVGSEAKRRRLELDSTNHL